MASLRFTILGCGSSGGVPRLGGLWGDCDPLNPKNRRTRCSLLVERLHAGATTRVLIDTSPDMREQLLSAGVSELDGVVFTHAHADHTHGIDDLRQVVFNMKQRLPVWADPVTAEALTSRFDYVFSQTPGSIYPSILDMHSFEGAFEVNGAAGPIRFQPFAVDHGAIETFGFRIGPLAYLPDAIRIPETSWHLLANLDCWIVDALRRTPHPTHAHLALTLDWIARARPATAVLTNMHLDMDYATLQGELPPGVAPAHDGHVLCFDDEA
ncbi:MAG: MBL fold metallo-hydrolase [Candidatus Saccharibacteria bacterium]|nr:MBL fold metallo-hydrolase [Pseudorhodobacter sp.]